MRANVPLKPGSRYRLLGSLASGGMGSVHLALRHGPDGDVPVAIKQLHQHLADDAQMVAMFVDEARIASRLSHPNIVRVHDVEMIGEDVVIVMELIEGVPLSSLLRHAREQQAKLPVPVVLRIMHDALLGLHAAHELRDDAGAPYGIVHRDVSPHNVLIGTDGVARIADFGIAKASGRLASTQADGSVKGKLQYLSPEQIYRRDIDRRTDIFAAGIVLWECLTGRKLFGADNEGETLARVLTQPIDPPSSERFEVRLELDEACLRALEREPARRFGDAAELAHALEVQGLASREEVAALVTSAGAASIAEHRGRLAAAKAAPTSLAGTALSTEVVASAGEVAPRRRSRTPLVVGLALVAGLVGGAVVTRMAPPARSGAQASALADLPLAASLAASPAPPPPAAPSAGTTPAPTAVEAAPLASAGPKPAASVSARAAGRRRRPAADGGAARPFVPEDL